MKIVVENIFMCLVLFWKCYFPTKFSRFLDYFLNFQTNFIIENFKITIITTNFSRFLGYFLNTTTTPPQQQQKSKSQREICGSKIGGSKARSSGEIEWCGAIGAMLRSTRPVRSGACDRRTGAQGSPTTSTAWSRLPLLPLVCTLSLSLLVWPENGLKWKFSLQTISRVKASFYMVNFK